MTTVTPVLRHDVGHRRGVRRGLDLGARDVNQAHLPGPVGRLDDDRGRGVGEGDLGVALHLGERTRLGLHHPDLAPDDERADGKLKKHTERPEHPRQRTSPPPPRPREGGRLIGRLGGLLGRSFG